LRKKIIRKEGKVRDVTGKAKTVCCKLWREKSNIGRGTHNRYVSREQGKHIFVVVVVVVVVVVAVVVVVVVVVVGVMLRWGK